MRGKKLVDDLNFVRFPWQLIYVRVPKFAKKRLKMTKRSNVGQSFRITAKALKLVGIIFRFTLSGLKTLNYKFFYQKFPLVIRI